MKRVESENIMKAYEHRVQYYETDQMKIVHHSNYIRWFEEARTYIMEQLGFGYEKMEEMGVISPVLEVSAKYKSMSRFGDTVCVDARITDFNGVKMTLSYTVSDKKTGEVRCLGESRHCFLNQQGKPISLKRSYPDIFAILNHSHCNE